ncbi:YfcE family phosphodiesterase [Criibacterium bergeronii]|uniref:Phosphoesterase n=1 Tax=Criibacterium bergeronii TaxID=1871336 RepID=A0A371IM57_9FIRM|nr:YfcE family phosphodiesterase [Criibacterium bergeronii]RDY21557.1 YfcE family phosphodiesterase [Criibacterium bergeronii]TRW24203.1 YfcE family phosphodiesterase [Criibacterium bergeronii]
MNVGFVSDTHGDEYFFKKAVEFMCEYDMIIHTGDVQSYGETYPTFISEYISTLSNIYFVRGNGDYFDGKKLLGVENDFESKIFNADGIKIFATHSHMKPMSSYISEAIKNDCKILTYGHTHVKQLQKTQEGLILLNPGSTSRPRDGIKSFAYMQNGILKLYNLEDFSVIAQIEVK